GKATCVHIDHYNLYVNQYRYQAPGVHGMPSSKHVGWESNAKTKPLMIGYSVRMVEADMIDIPDEDTVMEMSSYRQTDRFGDECSYKSIGMHDDHVSAFQIGCAMLRLRSSVDPRESSESVEIDDGLADDPRDSIPWDWKEQEHPRVRMPGQDWESSDSEDWEETLWYAEA